MKLSGDWMPLKRKKELEAALLAQLPNASKREKIRARQKKSVSWEDGLIDRRLEEYRMLHAEHSTFLEQQFAGFMTRQVEAYQSVLMCPVCGDGDRHNTLNGKPWCLKCNSPLIRRDAVKEFVKIRRLSKQEANRRITRELNPGLDPEES